MGYRGQDQTERGGQGRLQGQNGVDGSSGGPNPCPQLDQGRQPTAIHAPEAGQINTQRARRWPAGFGPRRQERNLPVAVQVAGEPNKPNEQGFGLAGH